MSTTNTSRFAQHYMKASEWLMNAVGDATAASFDQAEVLARLARDNAYVPLGGRCGLELDLADNLLKGISQAREALR